LQVAIGSNGFNNLPLESQLAINQGRRLQHIQLAIDEYILDDVRIDDLISPLDLFETYYFIQKIYVRTYLNMKVNS